MTCAANQPKHCRRRCQFGLKPAFVFIAVLCLPLAWAGTRMNQKRRERAVIAELERLGATVRYEWQGERLDGLWEFSSRRNAAPPGQAWLRRLLGSDFFSHVVYVSIPIRQRIYVGRRTGLKYRLSGSDTDRSFNDEDLGLVATLRKLEILDLSKSKIGDAGLRHLQGLTSLRSIDLSATNITDAGLVHLRHLISMRRLYLDGTPLAGSTLGYLKQMADLETLQLSYTSVTDSAIVQLKDMRRLRHLSLNGTRVSDSGIDNLRKLAALETLSVAGCAIGDSALSNCECLQGLRKLNLGGTMVTDAALTNLRKLDGLLWLRLDNTKISAEGIVTIRRALPNCEIDLGPLAPWDAFP